MAEGLELEIATESLPSTKKRMLEHRPCHKKMEDRAI